MTASPFFPKESKILFRLRRAPLENHLRILVPRWAGRPLDIASKELPSNASFVNYVRHHRILDPDTGLPIDLVEKSIRKLLFLSSQEARFHRLTGMLNASQGFQHPQCLGVIDTPWESLIFTTFVPGKPPRMQTIARYLGLCVAEQERLSNSYLAAQSIYQKPLLWTMDFFRPWFLVRPRFNFTRYLPVLKTLEIKDKRFSGLADEFQAFVPYLRRLAHDVQPSPRCISHMDYLRKNLFVENGHLHLIDWSEVKIGRVGFDAGSYLGNLFRRNDIAEFLSAQAEFTQGYLAGLPEQFSAQEALRNMHYVFLLTALYHCLRPEIIAEYRTRVGMTDLLGKYRYLLSLL